MIEFRIAYWEQATYRDFVEISVAFSKAGVEVTVTDVANLSPSNWDAARQYVNQNAHDSWSFAYGGTSLRGQLQVLEAASMAAIGALHVLTPAFAEAVNLEANPESIPKKYDGKILNDDMGNSIRVIGRTAVAEEAPADELMKLGQLQKLSVVVTQDHARQFRYVAFFMPFHVPIIGTEDISDAAHQLRNRIPGNGS